MVPPLRIAPPSSFRLLGLHLLCRFVTYLCVGWWELVAPLDDEEYARRHPGG